MDDREAYDVDDPKHPDFLEQWLDYADTLRKREKEDQIMAEQAREDEQGDIDAPERD